MSNSSSDSVTSSSIIQSNKPNTNNNNDGFIKLMLGEISNLNRGTRQLTHQLLLARFEIASLKTRLTKYEGDVICSSNLRKKRKVLHEGGTGKELIEAVRVIDKDHTGFVSTEQLRQVMKNLDFSDDEVDEMISYAIMDDNDRINHVELAKFILDNNGLQFISRL